MDYYYPRRYIPGYNDYPGYPSGLPASRPIYPALASQYISSGSDYPRPLQYPSNQQIYPAIGGGYPAYGSGYPPGYPNEYPPQTVQPEAKPPDAKPPDAVEKKPERKKVKESYEFFGVVLCILSIGSFGFEIANIAYTVAANLRSSVSATAFTLTCIVPGIWGSIPVFITGILAFHLARSPNDKKQIRIVTVFSAICALIFTPAIVVISALEIYNYGSSAPLAKFVLVIIVISLGGIEFFLTSWITIMLIFCSKPKNETNDAAGEKVSPKTSPQTDQPANNAPNPSSPYSLQDPGMINRIPTTFYRTSAPSQQTDDNGQTTGTPPDPDSQVFYIPTQQKSASVFSPYEVHYRPASNGGIGSLPSPLYRSNPTVSSFVVGGSNPAYQLVRA